MIPGLGSLVARFFRYAFLAPSLASVSPTIGSVDGGTAIELEGAGFLAGATVTFDGRLATSVYVESSTKITCVAPPHTGEGAVTIAVRNPDGQTAALVDGYAYENPPELVITSVTPSTGPEAGGTTITIEGEGFYLADPEEVLSVSIGYNFATFEVLDDETIEAVTPPGVAADGPQDVTVQRSDFHSYVLEDAFTYTEGAAAPEVISLDLGGVIGTDGGDTVVVTGTGFAAGATVTIDGTPCTSVVVDSSTQITCDAPALAAGVYDVVVENVDTQDSGASGAGLCEAWDPTEEGPRCLLLPGDYVVTGTQGVDAVGTWTDSSGEGNDAVSYGGVNAPAAASGCPDFVEAQARFLVVAESVAAGGSPMATGADGTIVAIAIPDVAAADAADYGNPALVAGDGATPNLAYSDAGFKFVGYNDGTADYETVVAPGAAAIGAAHIAFVRWGDDIAEARVNGGAFDDVAYAGGLSVSNTGTTTEVGRNYAGAAYFDGRIKFIAIFPAALPDATCTKLRSWALRKGYLS